jgi:phenylpropionate dioxygenase-like ring-hydroxylating dioxygenase large terminal subunit
MAHSGAATSHSYPLKSDDVTWTQIYPAIAGTEVTVEEHLSEAHFNLEVERVFRRTWIFAAMESDIRKQGDYIVREYPGIKASVILTRGKDGKVRGFHNACRHRSAKLLDSCAHGNAKSFTCEFHGWCYGTDGALLGMPDFDGHLDKSTLGLVPVRTETWNGFIFVNLDKERRESFDEFLGALKDHPLNDFPFTEMEWDSWRWRSEVGANWKVVKDLFIETYHVAFVHGASIDKLYGSAENPYHHYPAIDFLGRHHRGTVAKNGGAQRGMKIGPIGAASVKYGGAAVSRLGAAQKDAPGINPDKLPNWGADTYGLFPNFNIHLFGQQLYHYHLFEPLSAGRTMWENRIFFPKAKNAGERFAHAFSRSIQGIVSLEDMAAAERNQRGMELSGAPTLALHDQEIQLRFQRRVLRDYIQS